MLRETLRRVVLWLFKLLTRLDTAGLENLPPEGGILIAINHLSRLDGPLVFALLKRRDVTGLVSTKYQKNLFFRWLVNQAGGIWINREEADIQALRSARDYLRSGGGIGIAPEGTRSRTGQLIPAKTGVAYLAEKAAVPVIPVAVWGTEGAIAALFRLRRPSIHVRFGKPFRLPPVTRARRDEDLQRNTGLIMSRIAALLPEAYRGVYAGHPLLQEPAADQADPAVETDLANMAKS